ncbi:MAG: flagellin domain-containing protein [Puniceicoccaceae bacterium 5H]|nr:MAG: flagellin domain-containing protein [Puniceicoccaceae bacterium 5H]
MSNITLSAGMRSNLASLQQTNKTLTTVQERLSTGKKVNSAIDNPTNFFASSNLNDRATQLEARLDGMGQAVSTLNAADNGITAMRGIVSAMKGVVDEALASSDSNDRANSGKQFNELMVQLNQFAADASYKGVNLLQSSQSDRTTGGTETMTVQFNENFGGSTLDITGVNVQGSTAGVTTDTNGEIANNSDITGARTVGTATVSQTYAITLNADSSGLASAGTGSANAAVVGIRSADITGSASAAQNADGTGGSLSFVDADNYQGNLKQMVQDLEAFDQALVNNAKQLSQNVNIVSLRQDFTNDLINTLEEGADKLVLADLNEEGANLLALQTSQQLGISSLSLASQSQQSVLSLVG